MRHTQTNSKKSSAEIAAELDALNAILSDLESNQSPETDMVREHLESARFYLTGRMPAEFGLNLRMAKEAVASLTNQDLKSEIERFIDAQHPEP